MLLIHFCHFQINEINNKIHKLYPLLTIFMQVLICMCKSFYFDNLRQPMQSIPKLQLYCILQFCLQFYKPCTISNPSVINYFLLLWFIIGFLKCNLFKLNLHLLFYYIQYQSLKTLQWARKFIKKVQVNFFQIYSICRLFQKRKKNN